MYSICVGCVEIKRKRCPHFYVVCLNSEIKEDFLDSVLVKCYDERNTNLFSLASAFERMYSYSYNTSFDGEGAIDYVVNEEQPKIYVLEGHGEAELPTTFSEQLEKENMELNTFSLLTVDAIPEDAACVMIYAPTTDISQEEKDISAHFKIWI